MVALLALGHTQDQQRLYTQQQENIANNATTDALLGGVEALTAGKIGGAGLDVREQEPPTDNRFAPFDNVILTAHLAGVTVETNAAMSAMACENILQAAGGQQPHGLLNPEAGTTGGDRR